jgi:outer membrane lipopolysaccharide assembly protein LptE/RlpB
VIPDSRFPVQIPYQPRGWIRGGPTASDVCYGALVRYWFRTVIALVFLAEVSACGYHLVGTSTFLPEDIENLYVENFKNQTRWVEMDQRLMEAMTLEWVRRRRLRLVDSAGQADVVLSGVIQRLSVIPVSYDEQGRANEYQMSLQAIVQLNDVRSDEPVLLWEDKAFSRRTSYQVDPRAEDYFDRQNIAMDVLSEEFSSALVTAVLEGF